MGFSYQIKRIWRVRDSEFNGQGFQIIFSDGY